MRKFVVWGLIIALMVGSLAGCGSKGETPEPTPAQTQPQETVKPTEAATEAAPTQEAIQPEEEDCPVGNEDTYWVAKTHYREEEDTGEGPLPLDPALWSLDLTVWVDGTARFRDIHEGVMLMDDSYLHLTWELTPENEFLFYSALYPEPVLKGTYEDGVFTLDHYGTILTMQQEAMPQTAGEQYTPAELAGTWLMVSGETEGYAYEAMPAELSSIVFQVTSFDGPLLLSADIRERDYFGNLRNSGYGMIAEVLPQALHEGCENQDWCVRIGEASPLDENGCPTQVEYYATLLGENQLLLQQYYTFDGYPAVSHQTYWRLTDLVSWMDAQSMELAYSNWVCTGYEDVTGQALPLPAEMEGFSVMLCPEDVCQVSFGDGSIQEGTWCLEDGGVLRMQGPEEADDPFWFGGAISGYWVEVADDSVETYQMALYYQGGILKLALNSYG